jgi:hypothetical protein
MINTEVQMLWDFIRGQIRGSFRVTVYVQAATGWDHWPGNWGLLDDYVHDIIEVFFARSELKEYGTF